MTKTVLNVMVDTKILMTVILMTILHSNAEYNGVTDVKMVTN